MYNYCRHCMEGVDCDLCFDAIFFWFWFFGGIHID